MVTFLNRSGRAHLISGTVDNDAGMKVLEKVSDSLDCLYFHLRECPACIGVRLQASKKPGLADDHTTRRKAHRGNSADTPSGDNVSPADDKP